VRKQNYKKKKEKRHHKVRKQKYKKKKAFVCMLIIDGSFFLNFSKIMIFQLMTFVCRLITIFWDDFEMNKEKKIVVKWAWIRQQKHSELSPPLSWSHWWAGCCPARPIYQQLSKFSKNPS